MIRRTDRAMTTGRREDRLASVKEWSSITDDPADADRLRVTEEYADWSWRCRYCGGPCWLTSSGPFSKESAGPAAGNAATRAEVSARPLARRATITE